MGSQAAYICVQNYLERNSRGTPYKQSPKFAVHLTATYLTHLCNPGPKFIPKAYLDNAEAAVHNSPVGKGWLPVAQVSE